MNPEKIKCRLCEMDETHAELSRAICSLSAVWEALEHGAFSEKEYSDALYSVYNTIRCYSDEIRTQITALFAEMGVDAS